MRFRRVGLGAFALLGPLACAPAPAGPGPHVVLISVDTLRADRLGLYGYPRDTSPELDRFFGAGTVVDGAWSSAPCTIPSVFQMLSGAFDWQAERRTLAEHLRDAGYETAAVVSQQQFHRDLPGYARGFAHFDVQDPEEKNRHGGSTRVATTVSDRALAWLEEHGDADRFFLWLHYFDPHDPYQPPEAFRDFDAGNQSEWGDDPRSYQRDAQGWKPVPGGELRGDLFDAEDVAHFRNLYDGEIRYTDAEIGRVLRQLETSGIGERAIVALTADHGEWLGEEGRWYHCLTVREEEIQVPLLLRVNGGPLPGAPVPGVAASTLDLLPTVLGLLGLPFASFEYHGVDLREADPERLAASMWSGRLAVRNARWKLVLDGGRPRQLLALGPDAPRRNALREQPEGARALAGRAGPFVALEKAIRTDKIREALEAIGYIQ